MDFISRGTKIDPKAFEVEFKLDIVRCQAKSSANGDISEYRLNKYIDKHIWLKTSLWTRFFKAGKNLLRENCQTFFWSPSNDFRVIFTGIAELIAAVYIKIMNLRKMSTLRK